MKHRDIEPEDMDELLASLSIGELPYICPLCWKEKFFPSMTRDDANLYFEVMASGEWNSWPASWMGEILQVKESDLSGPMFRQLIERANIQAPIPYQDGGIEHIAKYGLYYYSVVMLATHYFATERNDTQIYVIRAKTLAPVFALVTTDTMIGEAMGELHQLEEEIGIRFPVRLLRAIVGEEKTTNEIKSNSIDNVMRVIHEWVEGHNNDVVFHGGFMAFDKEGNVVDDRLICYGDKKVLQISIDEFVKEFNKEEDGFVNW